MKRLRPATTRANAVISSGRFESKTNPEMCRHARSQPFAGTWFPKPAPMLRPPPTPTRSSVTNGKAGQRKYSESRLPESPAW